MKLADLAFACYVYSRMTDYDVSYYRFLENTKPQLDLFNPQHRLTLFKWLNDWGCRQFSKKYHEFASEEILNWFQDVRDILITLEKPLLSFSDVDFNSLKMVYAELTEKTASKRKLDGNNLSTISFGPTGTSKILFAILPDAMIPWDIPMRAEYQLDGSAGDYVRFLEIVRKHIEELNETCKKNGYIISEIPSLLGKPKSSLPKLIDEYNWVTISRKCAPPTSEELKKWIKWQ